MQALVHFTVGLSAGLLVLSVVGWPPRRELLCIFASGMWALIPDFHWFFREVTLMSQAAAWQSMHRSVFADLFWFHRLLDSMEPGGQRIEIGIAFAILVPSVLVYHRFNDWSVS